MNITLLLVGKTTNPHIQALVDDYTQRLSHYTTFRVAVIPELKNTKKLTESQQKQAEGAAILQQLQPQDHLILLDERGSEMRSTELAQWLQKKQNAAIRSLVFAIGGPYGFSPDVYARANGQISLSRLTFSHQLIRVIFAEQLYRAHTILRGEPYHHE